MLGGSLSTDLRDLLPAALRELYDLDELVAADVDGVLLWAVKQGASVVLGDIIGEAFRDAVEQTWRGLSPPPIQA